MKLLFIVGVAGFEPTTPCSQSRCANRTALHPEISFFCAGFGFTTLPILNRDALTGLRYTPKYLFFLRGIRIHDSPDFKSGCANRTALHPVKMLLLTPRLCFEIITCVTLSKRLQRYCFYLILQVFLEINLKKKYLYLLNN